MGGAWIFSHFSSTWWWRSPLLQKWWKGRHSCKFQISSMDASWGLKYRILPWTWSGNVKNKRNGQPMHGCIWKRWVSVINTTRELGWDVYGTDSMENKGSWVSSLHFCIFTTYLKHIIQDHCSHNLNVSYCQREMGKYVLLKVMDHLTLKVGTNFLFFFFVVVVQSFSIIQWATDLS